MAKSSLNYAKPSGSSLYAVLSLNILQSLELEKIGDLNQLGIFSLGDLLHYKPIIYAQLIASVVNRDIGHDISLEKYLDNSVLNTPTAKLLDLSIKAIEGIGASAEAIFNGKFNIYTISDLANFPPFVEAQRYLTPDREVFNEPSSAPEELMPQILGNTHSVARFNDYIIDTELELKSPLFSTEKDELNDVLLQIFETVTLTPDQKEELESALSNLYKDTAFSPKQKDGLNSAIFNIFQKNETFTLFFGIIASYTQKWVNMGTHLGEVIHSASMAPGETISLSKIEWYRRQSSGRDEKTKVDEKLTNNLVHTRALNEVVRATTNEHQSGGTSINSKTSSFGASANIGVSIPPVEGVSASMGESAVFSNNKQVGTVKSTSDGIREVLGDSQQNIMEATSQNSSDVRSLYSTVIVSDEQSEKEEIQTRSITNYNHSHMLNLIHYEILQKYNIVIGLDASLPIVFLPFKPVKFDIDTINRYWFFIKNGFVTEFPELYDRFNRVIKSYSQIDPNFIVDNQVLLEKVIISCEGASPLITLYGGQQIFNAHESINVEINESVIVKHDFKKQLAEYILNAPLESVKEIVLVRQPDVSLKRYNEDKAIIDNMVSTINVIINIDFFIKDSSGISFKIQKSFPKTISIHDWFYSTSISYANLGENKPIYLTNNIGTELSSLLNDLSGLTKPELIKEVETHFLRYRYSYTRRLLASIEDDQLIDIVEAMTFNLGSTPEKLTKYIYPSPIAITGNYLVFKTKKIPKNEVENPIWIELKKLVLTVESYRRDLNNNKKTTVFLPTAGVFGEAVLGRSNASEFVDPRRFWNWQDSPIPHLAPQIAPIQAGNHTVIDPTSVLTPNVPTSNLNIINPPQYALPTSLSDALQAVQNGNMFRDMSKSEALTTVLGSLAELANNTAKTAATMSGDAAERALKGALELGKKVGDMTEKAVDKKDKAAPPINVTEKAGALNFLDGVEMSGGSFTEKQKSMIAAMGLNSEQTASLENTYTGLSYPNYLDRLLNYLLSSDEDFTELTRGKGTENQPSEYHINHFIGYFKSDQHPDVFDVKQKTKDLYDSFDSIFSSINTAEAKKMSRKFKGRDTVRFNLGGNLGDTISKLGGLIHPDWVSLEMDKNNDSFFARTLKRNFPEQHEIDALKYGVGGSVLNPISGSTISTALSVYEMILINQYHFLAGRRSWKVGYKDFDGTYYTYYIETGGYEMYSTKIYDLVGKTGMFKIYENVREIWKHLILNCANKIRIPIMGYYGKYESDNDYNYEARVFIKMEDIKPNDPLPEWFNNVLDRHPGLLMD